MSEAGDRVACLRKLAGVMLGTSVRSVELHPVVGLDLFLVRLPGARPFPAQQASPGIGSHLAIDLGGRLEWRYALGGRERTRVVGEQHLWIQLAAWRLEEAERALVGAEDQRPFIAEKIVSCAAAGLQRSR